MNQITKNFGRLLLWYKKFQVSKSPQMNLVWGFFIYTLIGFIFLAMPFFHKMDISLIDTLFIATSAISTTGLVTIDIFEHYNFGGQLVILSLFQIGGIGYMTLTTYYLLFTTQRITRWHHRVMGTEFTLPKTIKIKDFIKSVIVFTFVMELLGAIGFFFAFKQTDMETFKAIWFAVFHSISAFCTAGFSLFSTGFEQFNDNYFINTIIAVLAIAGSLGFIVITDLWYRLTKRSKEISFTTKIVIYGFILLLFLGTSFLYFNESSIYNSSSRLSEAFFQTMSSMTTVGFNTISIGELNHSVLLLITFLMYVGASPSGTAGGLKITTLTAVISILKSRLLGQKRISFMNRIVPMERLYVATSTFILYTSIIFLATFLLTCSENFELETLLFEVASALGTVGLSTGITGSLSVFGKTIIILLMFLGRVGVLTFGFALLERKKDPESKMNLDDLAV